MPAETGTRFNFTARAGTDMTVRVTRSASMFAGYRHVHVSNGGFGKVNAGIDAPALLVGWQWR